MSTETTEGEGAIELSDRPENIIDGLQIGVVETGEKRTVNADNLEGGELVLEWDDETVVTTPEELYESLYVAGIYYIPEYTPAWEVNEALSRYCDFKGVDDE